MHLTYKMVRGHRFEAKHHKRLESSYRRRILPPFSTLKKFGLRKGMVVADIGAGTGYFSIPAARIVGKEGKVYSVDVSKDMLSIMRKKRLPSNIELLHSKDGYSFDIASEEVDYVIASSILHENEPAKFLKEVARIVKKRGKILIIEWRKESTRSGPPIEERLTPEEVKSLLNRNGMKVLKNVVLSSRYFAVSAKKE
jgi:ubiquinone/menaquinone biosynthesis C-methylase UbiE